MNFLGEVDKEWIANQNQIYGERYIKPIDTIPEKIPLGVFVRVTGTLLEGGKSYHPSCHGEPLNHANTRMPAPLNNNTESLGLVAENLPGFLSIRMTMETGKHLILNTGAAPLLPGDHFLVEMPSKEDCDAQIRNRATALTQAACGGPGFYDSMKLLCGGLLATKKIDESVVTCIGHKAVRDLDYLSSVDADTAKAMPDAAIKFGMNALALGYRMFEQTRNNASSNGIIKKFIDYNEYKSTTPPTYKEMIPLFTNDTMKTFICDGMDNFITYYRNIAVSTHGTVICSFYHNPTPINNEPCFNAYSGQNITCSAIFARLDSINGI